tara:strand:- start:2562 stop:4313 length:1752 start_codon:yes stop_codon:yes gene_type:complete
MSIKYLVKNGCSFLRQPFFFIVVFIVLLTSSCENKALTDSDEEVLFEVNDIAYSVFDFESKYVEHLINTGRNDTKVERYSFLNEMIDNLVLALESKEKGNLDDPIYKSAVNFQKRKSMMDFYFMDEMDKIIEQSTDDELRLAYAKRQRKVYVRHLFSLKEADLFEPYQRLERGDNFVDVANDYYETSVYDSTAGFLGQISYFGADDAFAEAAYSTNQGEYTKPIRSLYGYHIIYIEYIEFPAMLTEDEYQYRKSGLKSQVRLRKQKLVSNTYVRDLMSTLLVEVDAENLKSLKEAILNLSSEQLLNTTQNDEQESDFWDDQRLNELEASLDNNTVLATYLMGGERITFTFGDYLKWLPYLSFVESKNRTGASIGRGLRNQVLFQLAENDNYDRDERVLHQVKKRGYDVLSDIYQYQITKDALSDEESVTVPESFKNRLIKNKQLEIKADYWKVIANDLNEAKEIKTDIDNGGLAISYDSYIERDFTVINPSESDYSLIKKAKLGVPTLAHSSEEGWFVLNLNERTINDIGNGTEVENLEKRFKVYRNVNNKIIDLREKAEIKVDTLLFNDIYDLTKKKEMKEE